MEVLRCHGTHHETRILKQSTIKLMSTDQLGSIPGITRPGLSYGLGVGVVRDGTAHGKGASTGTIYWAGAPHNTFFFVDFEKGLSAALFMQSGPWGLDDIMNQFWVKTEEMFGSTQE
jgi:CubicO group peptidase (beta-lactamase class C family)